METNYIYVELPTRALEIGCKTYLNCTKLVTMYESPLYVAIFFFVKSMKNVRIVVC